MWQQRCACARRNIFVQLHDCIRNICTKRTTNAAAVQYTHTRTHIYTHTHRHRHTDTDTDTQTHTHTHTHTHTNTHRHTHTHRETETETETETEADSLDPGSASKGHTLKQIVCDWTFKIYAPAKSYSNNNHIPTRRPKETHKMYVATPLAPECSNSCVQASQPAG
jgi:hypothetical protein